MYATALARPAHPELVIRSLGRGSGLVSGDPAEVRVLGHDGEVTWRRDADALRVELPELSDGYGVTVRVLLSPRPTPPRLTFPL